MRQFLRSSKAVHLFRQLEPTFPRRFGDPLALVELLADRTIDPEERDAHYRIIVSQAQAGSQVAIAVIWLGLWAGLDRIFGQNYRRYEGGPDELISDLGASFMAAVHSARLERIECLAATLLMNTERRLKAGLAQRRSRMGSEEEFPAEDSRQAMSAAAPATEPAGAERDEVERVHEWLARRIPKDADLIVATVVLGETQKAFAERQGFSHEAIRKRHQRALQSLRGLSHFVEAQRLFRVRGKKPPPRRARR
jgi:hypothetical protein